MTLLRYSVERYRCFVDPASIEVRPLTLLFGRNASGKSALARTLPLFAQSALSPEPLPLALGGAAARGAAYGDIASRLSKRNALVFSVTWAGGGEPVEQVTIQLRDLPELHRQIVEDFHARVDGKDLILRFEEPDHSGDIYEVGWQGRSKRMQITFAGLKPLARHTTGSVRGALEKLGEHLSVFAYSVRWLQAVRKPVERVVTPVHDPTLQPDGDGVEEILAADSRANRALLEFINPYFSRMFGHELRVDWTSAGASVVLTPSSGPPVAVALPDTGEGASQVLAVMVLGALAHSGDLGVAPVLVLEQPEVHLHPGAERELAAFLATVAGTHNTRVIIETHSENLLLFVQLAVARGELSPKDVAVYFVRTREGDQGSVVDRIEIDPLGRPKGWPPGVFSEDVTLARELLLAQRGRAAAS